MEITPLSKNRASKALRLWFHRKHGSTEPELAPLQASGGELGSPAEAFAKNISPAHEDILGVPCRVEGRKLFAKDGHGDCTQSLVSLFVAEVSCASLSEPSWPELTIIAVQPPPGNTGLRGTGVGGGGGPSGIAWFLIAEGEAEHYEILDALSLNGCLRRDLEVSYLPPSSGDGVIGEGAYATVQCMRAQDGTAVAVKKMNAAVELDAIEREVATLLDINCHKNVVALYGLFWHIDGEGPRLSVVFECASHGDLLHKVLKYGTMTEITARPIFGGVVKGLAHIHSHGIVHRDVKAENILLKHDDLPLLADFGLATWTTDEVQMARRAGSPGYVAPEICLGTPYCVKVDIFGMGIVLYFMLSKEMPFSSRDRDTAATMRKTVKCNLHLHRHPWDTMSSRLRNILRQTICRTAEERLSADGVLEHAWMRMSDRPREPGDPSARVRTGERSEILFEHEAGQVTSHSPAHAAVGGNNEHALPTLSRDRAAQWPAFEDGTPRARQQQQEGFFLPRLEAPAGSNGYPWGHGPDVPDMPMCRLSVGLDSRMPGSRRNSA